MGIIFDYMPRQMILAALYGALKFMANGLVYRQLLVEMSAFLKTVAYFSLHILIRIIFRLPSLSLVLWGFSCY